MSKWPELRRWWHMRRWKRSGRCTDAEIAILRGLLPADDRRSASLLRQATDAPEVHRRLVGESSYRMTIPYVKDESYCIDAPRDYTSPPLSLTDMRSGRRLTFTVKVLRGGFLNYLAGTAQDGLAWPLEWEVTEAGVATAVRRKSMQWLPPSMTPTERQAVLERLAAWCGMEASQVFSYPGSLLQVRRPALPGEIAAAEARLGVRLPGAYRELVSICNGVTVRHGRAYEILGASEVYMLDWAGRPLLVITVLHEDGVAAIDLAAPRGTSTVKLTPGSPRPEAIGNLQAYVRSSLEWLSGIASHEA